MLPTKIHAWATTYEIDPMYVWEAIEMYTSTGVELAEIDDEPHLFQILLQSFEVHIETTTDDPTLNNLNLFLHHIIPNLMKLEPHMTNEDKGRFLNNTRRCDTEFIHSAMLVALNRHDF